LTNTTYTLTITDGNGCTATDETTVTVSDEPPVDAGADQSTCAGQPVVLGGAPTTSVPGASVEWSPSTGIDDPASFNPNAAPEQTTQYTVTVTSDTCTSQDMVTVSVEEGSEAGFSIRLEPNCDDIRAFLTDLSTGASQWLWDFGDGTTSTEQFPQHHFAYGSDIVVTLTVTDGSGCENSITQTYPATTFSELISYEVPNIFTPNGDGKNDVFKMNTEVILGACLDMKVFNRWGQKVFESDGGNVEWGGRNFAGEQCVTGTYFWTITIKDMAFSGSVYLNR
jgi:gliding motility-associated-like protein